MPTLVIRRLPPREQAVVPGHPQCQTSTRESQTSTGGGSSGRKNVDSKLLDVKIVFHCSALARLIIQASALIPATANMKYDKKNMERKLIEIRNELKVRKRIISICSHVFIV